MNAEQLEPALSALRRGLVVAAATETFFGLLADARQSAAIDRVLALKGRDAQKGVSLLLPTRDAWGSLTTEIPDLASRLADRFWPGPLTIALPARSDIDPRLTVDNTVAVRLPGDSDGARLAHAYGSPLTATSANLSSEPSLATGAEVAAAFRVAPGSTELFVLEGRAPGGLPSTLVAIAGDRVRLLRAGRITRADLLHVVPESALG